MMDFFAEHAAFKLLPKQVRRENVCYSLQKISGIRLAFDPHTNFAQALDPSPHRRTRNADLFGDARAADGDSGVVGKQREQGSEPPVGCARERGMSHGSCALLTCPRWSPQAG